MKHQANCVLVREVASLPSATVATSLFWGWTTALIALGILIVALVVIGIVFFALRKRSRIDETPVSAVDDTDPPMPENAASDPWILEPAEPISPSEQAVEPVSEVSEAVPAAETEPTPEAVPNPEIALTPDEPSATEAEDLPPASGETAQSDASDSDAP